ncbi:hypothetical protein CMUS01_01193 [Colletotrichum musicola]|uniref:Uncharacterized protein n=1 Tax=Colletotrichum musicola TaxID=2175873 RepID=A0A8H6U8A3_9PEZI|nr:hypothetical protein CMUS01_01193 [Colletotrichum musicola]
MSVRMTAPPRLGDAKMCPTVTGQQEQQEHSPPPQHYGQSALYLPNFLHHGQLRQGRSTDAAVSRFPSSR